MLLFRGLASFCEFGKDRVPEDDFNFLTVFCVHQRDHLPASLCSGQDPDTLGTGDEFFLLHHGKVREDVVMGDIEELRETPGGGEYYIYCTRVKVMLTDRSSTCIRTAVSKRESTERATIGNPT